MSNEERATLMLQAISDRRVPAFNWQWHRRVDRLTALLNEFGQAKLRIYSNSGWCQRLHSREDHYLVGSANSTRCGLIGYQIWAIVGKQDQA